MATTTAEMTPALAPVSAPAPAPTPAPSARSDDGWIAQRLMRSHIGRYAAAACGVAATLLFFQPWVFASLAGVGARSLSGLQLARSEAQDLVDAAMFGAGNSGTAPASAGTGAVGASSGAAAGGLVLPTRVPTVVPGAQPGQILAGQVQPAPGSGQSAQSAAAAGGLVLPTRVPTVAPGQSAPILPAAHLAVGQGQAAAAGSGAAPLAPAVTAEPETLPQFALYFLLAAALGLAVFPLVWERQHTARDRRFGLLWTLVVSYGGALWTGSMLRAVITAPPGNALVGPGVGTVTAATPVLWGLALAFALGAVCLTIAWLPGASPRRRRHAATAL